MDSYEAAIDIAAPPEEIMEWVVDAGKRARWLGTQLSMNRAGKAVIMLVGQITLEDVEVSRPSPNQIEFEYESDWSVDRHVCRVEPKNGATHLTCRVEYRFKKRSMRILSGSAARKGAEVFLYAALLRLKSELEAPGSLGADLTASLPEVPPSIRFAIHRNQLSFRSARSRKIWRRADLLDRVCAWYASTIGLTVPSRRGAEAAQALARDYEYRNNVLLNLVILVVSLVVTNLSAGHIPPLLFLLVFGIMIFANARFLIAVVNRLLYKTPVQAAQQAQRLNADYLENHEEVRHLIDMLSVAGEAQRRQVVTVLAGHPTRCSLNMEIEAKLLELIDKAVDPVPFERALAHRRDLYQPGQPLYD